jgi:hypothetical protein
MLLKALALAVVVLAATAMPADQAEAAAAAVAAAPASANATSPMTTCGGNCPSGDCPCVKNAAPEDGTGWILAHAAAFGASADADHPDHPDQSASQPAN